MSQKRICVPIFNRANYSSIKTALKAIQEHDELELKVIIGASALLPRYGSAYKYIIDDGFEIEEKIYMTVEGETPTTMAKSAGLGIIELATSFQNIKPDTVIAVGDRYETMAIAITAAYMNIPIAHTMGGEVSGTIDESLRHAITKLSHIHFPANKLAAERIIRMGENPDMVFNVGCPRVDMVLEIMKDPKIDFDMFDRFKGVGDAFDISDGFLLVSQHPVTTEYGQGRAQIKNTLLALQELEMPTIMLWPNVDAGSEDIVKEIRTFREKNDLDHFLHLFTNLPPQIYTKLMINCSCVIGNSSSSIREGAIMGTPAVNVGTRQVGRARGNNVIDVPHDKDQIIKAIKTHLEHGRYDADYIYGDGKAGERIAETLSKVEPEIQKKALLLGERLEKKILGIITARGGSKRIPRKNVKLLAGKPLIAYTIIEAKKSKYIDKLIVSTDDEEIAKISKEYGAEVPFMRPNELAQDKTLSVDVLIHAVKFLEDNNIFSPDIIVLLEPTAPLRTVDDIDAGIQKHIETDADSVVGVLKGDNRHPLKAKIIEDDKLKDYLFEEKEIVRSQDLPLVYFRNGAFYSIKRDILMKEQKLYGSITRPLIMKDQSSLDINSEFDFLVAEVIIRNQAN